MNKKKVIKISLWILNILLIFMLIWSIVNYKFLNKEVTTLVRDGGLVAMVLLVIFLEGAPVFVGPSVAVATVLAMNTFNPWFILLVFLLSALVGNVIYFWIGHVSGERILKYFPKEDVDKYREAFKKYGRYTMLIMAVSPIPYMPTVAGIFKMNSKYEMVETLVVRMIRHVVVFLFWFYVILGF